jgi:hypothetical protein
MNQKKVEINKEKEWLEEVKLELETQDNLGTDTPLYVVYNQVRLPADPECSSDGIEWILYDSDGDPDIFDSLEEAQNYVKESGNWEEDDIREIHYHLIKSFQQVFLTRKKAEEYLKRNKHNLKDPIIYVESGWNNVEIKNIIKLISQI